MERNYLLWIFTLTASVLYYAGQSQAKNFTVGRDTVSAKAIRPIPNDFNQCYVNVAVFNSSSHKYPLSGAKVTVLSMSPKTGSDPPEYDYNGFSEGTTDSTGTLCLLVYCYAEGLIFVEKNSVRIFASSKTDQLLPTNFYASLNYSNEMIHFHSFVWGRINGHSGPVYTSSEKSVCQNATLKEYHFVFSYISIPDKLESTPVPYNSTSPFDTTAWIYTLSPKTCYLKLLIKTKSTQLSVKAYSRLNDASGQILGLYVSGPKYDISSSDFTSKAVCLKFRCPTKDLNNVLMNTYVEGTIRDANDAPKCCASFKNTATSVKFLMNQTSFSTTYQVGFNYGEEDGVYMYPTADIARSKCFTGRSGFLGRDYAMNVKKGYAMEYDCTQPCVSPPPVG